VFLSTSPCLSDPGDMWRGHEICLIFLLGYIRENGWSVALLLSKLDGFQTLRVRPGMWRAGGLCTR
ncbi:hypothetical protein KI387_003255, partial [Taxus chinensis]